MTNKFFLGFLFLVNLSMFSQGVYNKLDEKGNKDGPWKGVYQDTKNPKFEGTFDHGKEVGTFTFFDNTKMKTVVATREFNPKDNSAYTIFYDQNKNKVSEGKVVNKLFEGEWKYYHYASPSVMTTENYKNGKLDGLRTVFFSNGKVAEQINFVNNQKQGLYKKYTENGIVLEESFFKNNEYDGLAIFRNDSGIIVSKGMFAKGLKTGTWEVLENGKLVKKSSSDMSQKSKIPVHK